MREKTPSYKIILIRPLWYILFLVVSLSHGNEFHENKNQL